MQIDRWLTEYQDRDDKAVLDGGPSSSVWIDPVVQRNISASSLAYEKKPHGTKVPNPATPIPPRTSAYSHGTAKVRPRYPRSYTMPEANDVTRIPTLPQPTMWQYESPDYEVESSVSSLSLVISETSSASSIPSIDELDTNPRGMGTTATPQVAPGQSTIVESNTTALSRGYGRSIQRLSEERTKEVSWTTGANSLYAQRIAGRGKAPKQKRPFPFHPVDNIRWWLLYPGRIEFLLWLGGTVILMSVTCVFLLVTVLSIGLVSFGLPKGSLALPVVNSTVTTQCSASADRNDKTGGDAHCNSTTTSSSLAGLKLIMSSSALLLNGMSVRFYGQGFSANGRVEFTHDILLPCSPSSTQADEHGEFTFEMILGPDWQPGPHRVTALDTASQRSVAITFSLAAPGKGGATPIAAPPSPGVTVTAIATATATPGNSPGSLPTPVAHTPVPITPTVGGVPTVGTTPTPVPTQSPPTPTAGVTPTAGTTPTPTVGTTPTPAGTPGTSKTPKAATSQLLSLNSELAQDEEPLSRNPLLWIAIVGYGLSMAMLGIAGLLHRRNRPH